MSFCRSIVLCFFIGFCFIQAKAQPSAAFSSNITAGCTPLIVNFSDLSSGNIKSWFWDFGNGNSSVIQNPGTFYINPGAYTVKLVVTDFSGLKDSVIKPYYISSYSAPTASFNADVTSGCAPLAVQFKDLSVPQSVPIISWYWNFGDGSSSNKQHPQHTYKTNGSYTVTLNVNDANGCQSFYYINQYIQVVSPKADFDFSLSKCSAPANCVFTNKSIGNGMSFSWNFGDGGTSNGMSPSHTFNIEGKYNVKLVCVDQNGCRDSIIKTIDFIKPDFSYVVSCPSPGSYTVTFTDLSSPKPTDWNWIFGDGKSSSLQNPVHIFDSVKSNTFSLLVNGSLGCKDTVKKTYLIPKAKFMGNIQICPSPFQVSFSNLSTGTGTLTYSWDFGEGGKSTATNPLHVYKEKHKVYSYVYTITLVTTNNFGCSDSIKSPISVSKPQADYNANAVSGCVPLPVNFKDISISSDPIVSYLWDFGDPSSGPLNTSVLKNPSHTYTKIGKYLITMIMNTANGCKDTISNYVKAGVTPDHLDFVISPSDTVCHHSLTSMTDISTYNDPNIKSDFWCWTARFDPATPTWHSDAFNWISCSDTGFSDPHNLVSTIYNTSHIFDQYIYTIKPFFKGSDTLFITNYKGVFGRDTIGLITGFNGCNDTLFKEIFVNGPSALSGYVLKEDTALAYCMPPVDIGFFNASLNSTVMNSFEIENKKTFLTEATITDPVDTTFITFHKAGIYSIKISASNNTTGCTDNGYRELTIDSLIHSFTALPQVSCANNNKIQFKDNSISTYGKIRNWFWDFGDGLKLFSGDTVFGKNILTGDTTYIFLPAGNYNDSVVKADSHGGFTNGTYGSPIHIYKKPGVYIVKTTIVSEIPYMLRNDWQYEYKQCTHTLYDTINIVGTVAAFSAQKTTVCTYDTVKFTDLSVSTGNITSWKWDFGDGSPFSNLKNPVHVYQNSGVYTVKLRTSDNASCNDSLIKLNMITVNAPVAGFTAQPLKLCSGDSVIFTNTSTGNTLSYTWVFDDNTANVTTLNARHLYTKAGNLNPYLIAIDKNSCRDTAHLGILVSGKPKPAFKADTLKASCPPLLVQFTDTSSSANIVKWNWDFGDGSTSTQSFPAHLYAFPGKYDVKLWVANNIGCADSLTHYAMITVGGPSGSFSFTPDSFCAPAQVVFNHQVLNADFLFMDYGDGEVTLFSSPNIPISQNHLYSRGGSLTPQLILKDLTGCTVTLPSPGLIYSDNLKADFNTVSDIFCSMVPVHFTNTSINPFSTVFNWDFDDGNSSQTHSPDHTFSGPGSYQVKLNAVSALACTSSISKLIKMHEKPSVSVMMRDTNWCVPLTLYFSAKNNTPLIPVESWLWEFGDGNTASGNQAFHTYTQKGFFDVKFHAIYGNGECSKDSTVHVSTTSWPVADFSFSPPNPAMNNPEVKFSDRSVNAISWHWDFGNGDTSILSNPEYTFGNGAVHMVKLIVKNSYGCSDTVIKKVFVADEAFVKAPTAFTPNNDGVNDKLFLFFSGIESLEEYKIFNRWGEIVYESKDLRRGWDGTFNGVPQDEGTFTYYVVGKASETKKKVIQKGTFTLIR